MSNIKSPSEDDTIVNETLFKYKLLIKSPSESTVFSCKERNETLSGLGNESTIILDLAMLKLVLLDTERYGTSPSFPILKSSADVNAKS